MRNGWRIFLNASATGPDTALDGQCVPNKSNNGSQPRIMTNGQYLLLIAVIVACAGYLGHRLDGVASEIRRFRQRLLGCSSRTLVKLRRGTYPGRGGVACCNPLELGLGHLRSVMGNVLVDFDALVRPAIASV